MSIQIEENNEVTPQVQHEELEQEEEPVDEELQKQMQKVTIDESVFNQKETPKQKEKGQKKSSKKKGEDFLEYANKNNIQINLQYGEEEKNSGFNRKKKPNDQYNNHQNPQAQSQSSNQKRQYNGENNNYNQRHKQPYNKGNQNQHYQHQQQGKRQYIKLGGNKFDACNQMPFQYGQPQFQYQLPQQQLPKEITLVTEEQILSYLERLLSLTSLNRDLYLRYRINDKGLIHISELANYYGLKNNAITPQKIIDVITKNDSVSSIGIVEEDGSINVSIKHWNTISPQLNSIEVITAKKKQMKMQQMQLNQYTPYTYIAMQNNYFLQANEGGYAMQGYANPNANANANVNPNTNA